ncbi:MAG: OmpA family protein [Alphaproteobacteria bacterium]
MEPRTPTIRLAAPTASMNNPTALDRLPQPIATASAPTGNVTLPGEAVLAPPPPPTRAPAIASRPERQSALPVPATETSGAGPRRSLSIPPSLARVTPPGAEKTGLPQPLLTPPPMGDLSAAPDFAPLPLPTSQAQPRQLAVAPLPLPIPQQPEAIVPAPRNTAPRDLALAAPNLPGRGNRAGPVLTSAPAAARSFETAIAFSSQSRALPSDAEPALARIVARMKNEQNLKVRLSGSASTNDPKEGRSIALSRSLAVQQYLISRGVSSDNISVEPVTGAPRQDRVIVRLVVSA